MLAIASRVLHTASIWIALLQYLILYSTSACHLCEQAEAMLDQAVALGVPLQYRTVDISESDALFERYGVRIPVLRKDDNAGRELGWPFDPEQLLEFLGQD